MPAFVFSSIDHGIKHLNVKSNSYWAIKFINNETRVGRITEIDNGSYLLEDDSGEFFYFDGRKVLYMKPLART